MSSTDDRIVRMQFDNAQFKRGAAETKQQLADVNKSVDAAGKNKGLLNLNSNMQQVAVTASKMQVVATTAIATITAKAVDSAVQLGKSLTLAPMMDGFREYESLLTKQNVIMNATGKSAGYVKRTLNDLNAYSDKTIYSFGDMTSAVQKFVNAGISLPMATQTIKGIGNAAAFSGASSEEASRAMYAFSQSMSLGFVGLQDWNQIENANMGTVKFKNELLKAAEAAGTLKKQGDGYVTSTGKYVSATKGWRDGLQEQWATTEVLNKALGKYADTNTKLGRKAFKSAQQVRTFSAFMDTLKESLGSGWASIFTSLIGGLGSSTRMWTGLSESVGGAVQSVFGFLTTTLTTWRKMGGFQKTLEGIKNILAPFGAILEAIGEAWRAAFPNSGSGSGKALYGLSAGFAAITSPLQLVADLIRGSVPFLTVFFQTVKIGGTIIGNAIGVVKDFVGSLLGLVDLKAPSSGGFIGFVKDLASAVADAVDQVSDLLAKGKSLTSAFGSVDIKMPDLPDMPDFGSALGGKEISTGSVDTSAVQGAVGIFKSAASSIKGSGDEIGAAGDRAAGVLSWLKNALGATKDAVMGFISDLSFEDIVAGFNMAIFTVVSVAIARFLNSLRTSFTGFAEIFGSVGQAMEGFAGAAQKQAWAAIILNFAIAIGVLAAALLILSFIPADKLKKALATIAVAMVLFVLVMKNFAKIIDDLDGKGINLKIITLSVAIVAMAGAMLLLSLALLVMNKVDWQSIAKGLVTMFVTMKMLESLGNLGRYAAKNLVAGAAAIAIVAGAMIVLAGALLLFKLIDWESMGKAGAALGGVSLAVGLLALIPYQGIAKVGGALLAASVGMLAIANAFVIFGAVKWESIWKGIVVLGALTIALGALMFVGNPVTISGVVGLGAAMVLLAGAMMILNEVEWASIAKISVIMLALLAAFSLLLVILTIAAPIIPVLGLFALAVLALGAGLAAFAAGMAIAMSLAAAGTAAFAAMATGAAVAIAVFLTTLAAEAPVMKDAFLKILQALIDTIVEAVPMVIDGVKRLFAAIKDQFSGGGAKKEMNGAGGDVTSSLGDGIKKKMPEIVKKARELIVSFINGLIERAGSISAAGARLLAKLIEGLASRLGEVIQAGANLIISWVQGITKESARVARAAAKAVIDFINKMAEEIRVQGPALGEAMGNLGSAMVEGLITGIASMAGEAIGRIKDLAGDMVSAAKDKLKVFSPSRVFRDIGKFIVQGLTNGVQDNAAAAITSVASMVSGQISMATEYISRFIQKLDQQAIAAQGKAAGLASAAQKAAKAADVAEKKANKTKGKADDKRARKARNSADRLANKAERASDKADTKGSKVESAIAREERQKEFQSSDLLGKAQMRSEDAQRQLDSVKASEARAQAALTEAAALDKASRAAGLSKKQRKEMREEADRLRKVAAQYAKTANQQRDAAQASAQDALRYQHLAGAEAAKAFQDQYDAEARAEAEAEAFDKLSDKDKAAKRREQAAAAQKQADADLAEAKRLAYSDIEAANELAILAMDGAERARQFMEEAEDYEASGGGPTSAIPVDLEPGADAAALFNRYADLYDAGYAAMAAGPSVQFNQYNSSPEALNDIEIYRHTNNLVTYAADKVAPAA